MKLDSSMHIVKHLIFLEKTGVTCAKRKTHDKLFVCRAPREKRKANYFFVERFSSPYALENPHGKAPLCHAPEKMRTAKFRAHDKDGVSRSVQS
jgi:hypothetical protein